MEDFKILGRPKLYPEGYIPISYNPNPDEPIIKNKRGRPRKYQTKEEVLAGQMASYKKYMDSRRLNIIKVLEIKDDVVEDLSKKTKRIVHVGIGSGRPVKYSSNEDRLIAKRAQDLIAVKKYYQKKRDEKKKLNETPVS